VRRSVWERFPYNEQLTGLEDVDLAKRALAQSLKLAYVAEAPVVHVHHETPRRIFDRYRREALALRSISPNERVGLRDLARLLPAHVVSDCYHALRDGLLLEKAPQIAMFRSMQFLGTWRGWSTRGQADDTLRRRFYYPTGLKRPKGHDGDAALRIEYGRGSVVPDGSAQ
jgi:rhamnosyltransferase